MALTVNQGFTEFLSRLTPTQAEKDTAAKHRTSVENSLKASLWVAKFRQTGSFHHGTGVRFHADVDLLVSLSAARPGSTDTALNWVKDALKKTFPYTTIRISWPAVVVEFNSGKETWEVIPAFYKSGDATPIYTIPGFGEWITSAPTAHLDYVNEVNNTAAVSGGAKRLARYAKAWKYYKNLPLSSFYLEMRAAEYMARQTWFDAAQDMYLYLKDLENRELAAMNDPKGLTSRINATSTETKRQDALSKLGTAVTYAKKAVDANTAGKTDDAFYYWNLVFGGMFPAR